MNIAAWILGAVALGAWLVIVVSSVLMVEHRAPGVSRLYFVRHGTALFDESKFTAGAEPHRRRMRRAAAVCLLCVVFLFPLKILAGR